MPVSYLFWSLILGPTFLGVNWDPGFVRGAPAMSARPASHMVWVQEFINI